MIGKVVSLLACVLLATNVVCQQVEVKWHLIVDGDCDEDSLLFTLFDWSLVTGIFDCDTCVKLRTTEAGNFYSYEFDCTATAITMKRWPENVENCEHTDAYLAAECAQADRAEYVSDDSEPYVSTVGRAA